MKKTIAPLAAILLLALASPAFAEWEFGMSWTPAQDTGVVATDKMIQSITGFHVGYGFWYVVYGTWDALAIPPFMTSNLTQRWDENGNPLGGYNVPGFLNLYDIGVRFVLQPFVLSAQMGINNVYVYKEGLVPGMVGANVKIAAGLKFGIFGVGGSLLKPFGSFNEMQRVLGGLLKANTREWATQEVTKSMIPSLTFTLYLF